MSKLRLLVLTFQHGDPGSIPSDFMMDEVSLEQFFSELFHFPLLFIILPLLHIHLSPPHEVCDSPGQAAHYHTLGPKLGLHLCPGTWLVSE
jgi:hypothetical protein